VAPKLQDGIKLLWLAKSLQSNIMTLALLNDLDIKTSFEGNVITVYPNKRSSLNSDDCRIRLELSLLFF
jgi:3-phosphoshikimate 1-carboxyvinyltransferase